VHRQGRHKHQHTSARASGLPCRDEEIRS